MSAITFTGNPGPFQRQVTPTWRKGAGWSSVVRYEGARDGIVGLIPTLQIDAEELTYTVDGPIGSLEVRYNRDAYSNPDPTVEDQSETTWELDPNEVEKDLFEHSLTDGMTTDEIAEIRAQISNFDTGSAIDLSGLSVDQQKLFTLAIKGTRKYAATQWTLRKTKTVPKGYNEPADLTGVNLLYTTAQVAALEGIDQSTLFSISSIEIPANIPDAYLWSWLKKGPQVLRSSSGRFQMIETWVLDAWAVDLYTAAT